MKLSFIFANTGNLAIVSCVRLIVSEAKLDPVTIQPVCVPCHAMPHLEIVMLL